jgi:hypothetical protein
MDSLEFNVIPEMAHEIRGGDPFRVYLEKAHGVTDIQLKEIIEAIPADWNVTPEERCALLEFLRARRGKLSEVLERMRAQFPFWTRPEG